MSKTRTKCHCGEQYVMVDATKAKHGGTESCGAPTCTEPIGPVTRPQHDTSPTPHRRRGGTEMY